MIIPASVVLSHLPHSHLSLLYPSFSTRSFGLSLFLFMINVRVIYLCLSSSHLMCTGRMPDPPRAERERETAEHVWFGPLSSSRPPSLSGAPRRFSRLNSSTFGLVRNKLLLSAVSHALIAAQCWVAINNREG